MQKPQDDLLKKLEISVKTEVKDSDEQRKMLLRLQDVASKYTGDDEIISTADVMAKIKSEGEQYKMMTQWTELDKVIGGFTRGQLVVVSALTKSGKTSWCIDLTTRLKDEEPCWIPYEETGEELVRKFLERGEQPPHFYLPKENVLYDLVWVEARIIEAIVKHGSRVFFIDNLDFIVPFNDRSERNDLQVAHAVRICKHLARKWNVVIFLVAHLKKTDPLTPPTYQDLKGSSAIGQLCDTLIMLWRHAEQKKGQAFKISSMTTVSVQLNRRVGTTGNITMDYNKGKFFEVDAVHAEANYSSSKKVDDDFNGF